MMDNLNKCEQCGIIFTEDICPSCTPRRMNIQKCFIEEAKGRCEEYEDCLYYKDCLHECSKLEWIGWRRVCQSK